MKKNDFIAEYQKIVGYLFNNPTEADVEYWLLKLNILTGQLAEHILQYQINGTK